MKLSSRLEVNELAIRLLALSQSVGLKVLFILFSFWPNAR
jgi:hypothetical protein